MKNLLLTFGLFGLFVAPVFAQEKTNFSIKSHIIDVAEREIKTEKDSKVVLDVSEFYTIENQTDTINSSLPAFLLVPNASDVQAGYYREGDSRSPYSYGRLEFTQDKNLVSFAASPQSNLFPSNPKQFLITYKLDGTEFKKTFNFKYPAGAVQIWYKPLKGHYPEPVNFDFVPSPQNYEWYFSGDTIKEVDEQSMFLFKILTGNVPDKYKLADPKFKVSDSKFDVKEISKREHLKIFILAWLRNTYVVVGLTSIVWLALIIVVLKKKR